MKITNLKNASAISGGKASGLALLNKMGVPVPAGFVIDDTLNIFDFLSTMKVNSSLQYNHITNLKLIKKKFQLFYKYHVNLYI